MVAVTEADHRSYNLAAALAVGTGGAVLILSLLAMATALLGVALTVF
jgi:hypothetical protein